MASARIPMRTVWAVMGLLFVVEFTSGILQGYYTPLLTDIARYLDIPDADVNWFEGGQLMLSALIIPAMARLGDMFGHRRILLISLGVTAIASYVLAFAGDFWSFLIAWSLQGFYIVWLPMLVALIYTRARELPEASRITRKAAGILVASLETGVIVSALLAGQLAEPMIAAGQIQLMLLIPAFAVTACFFIVLLGVPHTPAAGEGGFDTVGAVLLTLSLLVTTAGLSFVRINGIESPLPWIVIVLGVVLLIPFTMWELRHEDPLIDIRMVRRPTTWPVFVTAALFGVSVLGAQAPLSTFARTDPAEVGYGLGASAGLVSILLGAYVLSLVIGALLFPLASRLATPRTVLIGAALLVAGGYFLFLPFHHSMAQALTNMIIAGVGSGALVAALPAAAAAAAPPTQTGVATGLTNATKTVGGAVASAVFGLVLLQQIAETTGGVASTAGAYEGYLTVWILCGSTALLAALLLCFVPKVAFQDPDELPADQVAAGV